MLHTLKRKECYQGCFGKWSKQRQQQKWDEFALAAPELAKTSAEVPNALRAAMDFRKLKWSGSKFGAGDGLHKIPDCLALAIEDILLEVMSTGQEVCTNYVKNLTVEMVEMWNSHVTDIRTQIETVMEKQGGKHVGSPLQAMIKYMKPCDLSKHPDAIKKLG